VFQCLNGPVPVGNQFRRNDLRKAVISAVGGTMELTFADGSLEPSWDTQSDKIDAACAAVQIQKA